MTLYVPLEAESIQPNSPPFLVQSHTPEAHLAAVIQAILKAKRIAVICGAGISVDAGIPDFRSPDGLFRSLKRDNPKESLTSGRDLFDASVFKSTQKTALFCRMIARLSSLSSQGRPTPFHQLLRTLDDRGQLLRVYTQNIDALEMKVGLSFGVPEFEEKALRVKLKGKAKAKAKATGSGNYSAKLGRKGRLVSGAALSVNGSDESSLNDSFTPSQRAISSSPVSPTRLPLNAVPRCIPLHGTLLTLHCQHCTQSFPLDPPSDPPSDTSSSQLSPTLSPPPSPQNSQAEIPSISLHSMLELGTPPPCPSCTSLEQTRALVGNRLRGIGRLRPSVVLYGEEHREGEGVGEAVRRDLCGITNGKSVPATSEKLDIPTPTKSRVRAGKGPDLLLVVGTSLRVPGTKRIVREFSKAVRPAVSPSPSRLPTPVPSPPATDSPSEQIRTVYLNLEFPLPSREWEGVFDIWVNGDVQMFAKAVDEALKSEKEKTAKKPKSFKRDRMPVKRDSPSKPKMVASIQPNGKRKADVPETPIQSSKKRKFNVEIPPTPVSHPRHRKPQQGIDDKSAKTQPHTPTRRVILRLPPRPTVSAPTKPPKRKRSIPEVVITSKPGVYSRSTHLLSRSLSPLTSLSSSCPSRSSLTPPPSVVSPTSSRAVNTWRQNLETQSADPREDIDLRGLDDTALTKSFPTQSQNISQSTLWQTSSWQTSSVEYTYT